MADRIAKRKIKDNNEGGKFHVHNRKWANFECEFCEERFVPLTTKQNHEYLKHGAQHFCHICFKMVKSYELLQNHYLAKHPTVSLNHNIVIINVIIINIIIYLY